MTKHPRLLCSPSETMFPPQKAQQNLCRGTVYNTTRTFHRITVLNISGAFYPETELNITKTLHLGTITHFQVEYHLLHVSKKQYHNSLETRTYRRWQVLEKPFLIICRRLSIYLFLNFLIPLLALELIDQFWVFSINVLASVVIAMLS